MEEDVRLIVAADDPLARAGLAALLAAMPGCLVVGQTGAQALRSAEPLLDFEEADAVIWDVGWGDPAGDEGIDLLTVSLPVVALVSDGSQAGAAWSAGSRGILFRELDGERILAAVRAVMAGLTVMTPALAGTVLKPLEKAADDVFDELTPREVEVLALLAEGLTNKAIGFRLAVSEHTVKFHVNAILSKLSAQSRTEAVVKATRLGLISL